MKMDNATLECEIFDTFPTEDDRLGVILASRSSGKVMLYLSYMKDLVTYRTGSDERFVEIPVKVPAGSEALELGRPNMPDHMVEMGFGPMIKLAEGLRKIYLSHLYNRPLYRSMGQEEKKFDPTTVFSYRTLVLIQAAYKHLSGCDIHEVLRENDYQYERLPVYTSFHDADGKPNRTIYNTPRTLNYYPDISTIRVSWTIGGTPRDVVQYNDPSGETALYIKSQPFQLKIQRVYQNEGWLSLREAMKHDATLHAFVKQFYENGYGLSGERNLTQ